MYDWNSNILAFLITFLVGPFASQGTNCVANLIYFAVANKATWEDKYVGALNQRMKENPLM